MIYRKFTAKTAAATVAAALTISLTAPVAAQETYTIQRGDELGTIARRIEGVQVGWRELCSLNSDVIGDCDILEIGTIITLPDGARLPTLQGATEGASAEASDTTTNDAVYINDTGTDPALPALDEQIGFRTSWSVGERLTDNSGYFVLAEATENNPNGSAFHSRSAILTPGTYVFSTIAKASETNQGVLALRPGLADNFGDAVQAWFDITSGTVLGEGSASGSSTIENPIATIQALEGGAFLCSVSFTLAEEALVYLRGYITDSGSTLDVSMGQRLQFINVSISSNSGQ